MDKDLIKRIGEYVLVGLTEEEACVLSGISPEELQMAKDKNPTLDQFILKKKIEFKKNHLEVINAKRDPKSSFWILERLIPEQFASKRKSEVRHPDVLNILIQQIHEQSPGLVKIHDHKENATDIITIKGGLA